MKLQKLNKSIVCLLIVVFAVFTVFAQKRRKSKSTVKEKPIIFALMNDGTTLEPIGIFDKGELVAATGGDADQKALTNFAASYYKPKTAYKLIFGGTFNGLVTVKNSNIKTDCAKNLATVSTVAPKVKIKGLVMGLATNGSTTKTSGVRRLPTVAERDEIENLVRAEYAKNGVAENALKDLHYYNLTAIDVNNDGKAELVGSYWVESSAKERNSLFFIADKNADGKYALDYSEYKKLLLDEVMSKDFKDLANGIDNELLLDSFAFDGDKTDEIFTVTQGFEGNNFKVYSRRDGKWVKAFEGSNYHCAY